MRITRKLLDLQLGWLLKLLGKEQGFKPGQWGLDYAACYGGYVIVEYEENGGESHPLGQRRLSVKELSHALNMMIALESYKRQNEEK